MNLPNEGNPSRVDIYDKLAQSSSIILGMENHSSRIFETERTYARRLIADDAMAIVAIFGDEESMRFVGDGKILNADDCRYWINDVTEKNFQTRGYGLIGIFDNSTDDLVACTGVFHPGQQAEPEVMYYLRRDWWGQGLATEIVIGLVAFARSEWKVGRMVATVAPGNIPSRRVIAKAGFIHTNNRPNEDGTVTQVWELPII